MPCKLFETMEYLHHIQAGAEPLEPLPERPAGVTRRAVRAPLQTKDPAR
jgi:hypothetical protein